MTSDGRDGVSGSRASIAPSPSLRSVLLTTDFSEGAAAAVYRVARLPLAPTASVTIVHVSAKGTSDSSRERLEQAAEQLRAALGDARARVAPRIATKVLVGRPFEEIAVAGRDAELIVLGRHGSGGFVDLLLGSTAERVVQTTEAAVLVVGARPRATYRRAVVGLDLTESSARALDLALRLVPAASAVELVHVYDPLAERAIRRTRYPREDVVRARRESRREALRALASFVARHGAPTSARGSKVIVRAGDPRAVLLDRVKHCEADLIAVGARRRSALARIFLGDVVTAVLRYADCDVLVVPSADRE
jgi:nucleotide-binding universal stress UspA family protein